MALAFPVAIAAAAFNADGGKQWGKHLLFAFVMGLGQGLMYELGSILGNRFMYLIENLSKIIVVALCLAISFRMLTDTLKIRKGGGLFFIEKPKQLILLAIATGINAFIAGLMTEFYLPLGKYTFCFVALAGLVWGLLSIATPFSRMKLTFYSFLNLIFSIVVFASGIVFII